MSRSTALQRYERIHLQAPSYGACKVCVHGPRAGEGQCRHPALADQPSQDIQQLRATGGACGPEAEHMDFPGLSLA